MSRLRHAGAAHPYAENETNYCPRCQTGGTLLADRSLSRLLKDDWPKTIEELEEMRIAAVTGRASRSTAIASLWGHVAVALEGPQEAP